MAEIITVTTAGLGDRSYLAHDGEVAIAVDPQRDIDRMLSVADDSGVRITHVVETHIHNDYVTGGYALAQAVGAAYVTAAADDVAFERTPVSDGQLLETGDLTLRVLHTPGHTPTHLSYVLADRGGEASAVFTGGSLLYGAVGRTDLTGPGLTERLARAQYRSAYRLAAELPDDVVIYPTHGFGSFCSATPASGESSTSTIGRERSINVAFSSGEDAFVKQLLAGLIAYPRYYAHMEAANRGGPAAPDLTPAARADAAEIRRRIDAGEWVVDLRQRRAFAQDHITGTISVELDDSFCTYLGWTIQWGTPLTLIGESPEHVAEAQRQLTRIGIDQLATAGVGEVASLSAGRTASYPVAGFEGLAAVWGHDGVVILDVRRPDEWQAGHLEGAVHIPFWELEQRMGEVPDGEVWVHCGAGHRAAIGASLLDRAGRRAVHVDDDWPPPKDLGLPVTGAEG